MSIFRNFFLSYGNSGKERKKCFFGSSVYSGIAVKRFRVSQKYSFKHKNLEALPKTPQTFKKKRLDITFKSGLAA